MQSNPIKTGTGHDLQKKNPHSLSSTSLFCISLLQNPKYRKNYTKLNSNQFPFTCSQSFKLNKLLHILNYGKFPMYNQFFQ